MVLMRMRIMDGDGDSDSDGCFYEGCYYGYVVDGDDSDNYCTIDILVLMTK